MKQIRESNIELLRILSMLMIIAHHLAYHGLGIYYTSNNFNYSFINMLNIGGKIGVNIFVLISGYFMCTGKITFKKILKLIGQIIFYSLIFYIWYISYINPSFKYEIKEFLIHIIFPADFYWFATTYILLMIFSPFINKMLENITKKMHLQLIILLVTLYVLCPIIYPMNVDYTNIAWFITLYLIGSYLRKNKKTIKNKPLYICFTTFLALLSIYVNHKYGYINNIYAQQNGLLSFSLSLLIFIYFLNTKPFKSKFINLISASTFGIYLIHDNEFFRNYFWNDILQINSHLYSRYLWAWAIICIVLGFIICSIIDIIRKYTFEKYYMKLIDFISNHFTQYFNKIKNNYNTNKRIAKE